MTPKSILLGLIYFLPFSDTLSQGAKVGLFDQDEVLELTIKGKINDLLADRKDKSSYHSMMISYAENQDTISIPVRVKTRGHFRLNKENCSYPPLLLNFSKESTPKHSIFRGQDKLKLVTACRGDKYVVREYLAYKLYNVVTPKSFRARLVSVTFEHERKGKKMKPHYGILLEETDQMAERNEMVSVKRKLVLPENTVTEDFLKMSVFEYLIGNTDWSIQYLQNVKLIGADSTVSPSPVPYDFDHAGIVGASYAKPAEELLLASTQIRRYRGYCMQDIKQFDPVLSHFNNIKEEVYGVYNNSSLIEPEYRKWVTKYLDDFYKTINNPSKMEDEFSYPCRKAGTGHVVIKGMK